MSAYTFTCYPIFSYKAALEQFALEFHDAYHEYAFFYFCQILYFKNNNFLL